MNPVKKSAPQPCIIFLKGVNRSDYKEVEDQFDQLLLENSSHTETAPTEQTFDILPNIFTSMNTWPKSTNLHCWTCECTFLGHPIFIPLHIKNISTDIWDINTYGIFCSFSCATRHVLDFMAKSTFTNLYFLYFIFYNKTIDFIHPSPRRFNTRKYGGHMTESEYIEEIRRLEHALTKNEETKKVTKEVDDESDREEMSIWNITTTEIHPEVQKAD